MKQEEQLAKLFKAAREEEVHFSYEKLVQEFKQQTSMASTIQQLLSKIIHMNTLLIILTGGLLGSLWYFYPTPSENTVETITSAKKFSSIDVQNEPLSDNTTEIQIENTIPTQHLKQSQNTAPQPTPSVEKTNLSSTFTDSNFLALDTPTVIDFPITLALEKETLTNSISPKSALTPPQLKQPIIFHQLIEIDWQDDPNQILKTKQAIADVGFEVKKLNTNRRKKNIEKVTLYLTHSEGLDWKFTVTDFKKIELKIVRDDKVGLRAFAYRFNEKGAFSPLIYLSEKSVSRHKVASGTKGRHINKRKKQN